TRWLKDVGEEIEYDESLLEVSTVKVATEVPSPVAGTVQAHLAEEDETVEVGAPLARIGSGAPAESAPAAGQAPAAEEAPNEEATRLNSSHVSISYAVFCLKKKNKNQ